MTNQEFLEQVAKEQINHVEEIQIEFQGTDIIIVNTFVNELYDDLYAASNGAYEEIIKLLTTEEIKPFYDNQIGFLKIRLVNILNENNYNIKVLLNDFESKYSWVVRQLLDAIKEIEKDDDYLIIS